MFAANELSCLNWPQAHLRDLPGVTSGTSSSSPSVDSTESTRGISTDFNVNSGHTLRQRVLSLTVALFINFVFVSL